MNRSTYTADVAKQLVVLSVAILLLASAGCGDDYDGAMKRLVAEQKQLDWIDKKLKEIEDEGDRAEKAYREEMNELKNIPSTASDQELELTKLSAKVTIEARKLEAQLLNESMGPWIKKRREQLERVEEAQKSLDRTR